MSRRTVSHDDQEWQRQKRNLVKQKFTDEEDNKLRSIVESIGTSDWKKVALHMRSRNARQCRERWNNYINPSLNDAPWTPEEDQLIEKLHLQYGTRWNKIGKHLKNRSDNSIRNRWMKINRSKRRTPSINETESNTESSSPQPQPTTTLKVTETYETVFDDVFHNVELFNEESFFTW